MRRRLLLFAVLLAACGAAIAPPPAASAAGLWADAAIFQEVGRLLADARRLLLVEMYEFDLPQLSSQLAAARERGLDVRVIVDPTVAESRRTAGRLQAAGVPVRTYPVDDRRHQIDHVKLLIADQTVLAGGMNWGRNSHRNHDYALESRAPPVVARVLAIFEQDWSLAGGRPLPLAARAGGPVAQTAPGEEIRGLLQAAAAGARGRVWAEVFVFTDPTLLSELVRAHRRGADVRILLDPRQDYNRQSFSLLSRAGVGVRWFPAPAGAKLHAKAGLFDRRLVLGSANWSLGGLDVNHELDLATDDAGAVDAFAERFRADWAAVA
ncbi:MAG TPA: phosphatidylserine/phosphatidylglycerophosphate/cardiolipin synthase family protein [Candidatus Acidoferrales bacterium]|nr:phosphatidylserine/phosphatidylglycerophosphate/cardiolipin synthase family protein [Candidatus Acidoferrales bacterium]